MPQIISPPWLDKEEFPFSSHTFVTSEGNKLHYIDEGEGIPVVFLHGTPSWSFDFRRIIKQISCHYRCLAIDHLGFGLSDKPMNGNYSIESHAKRLEEWMVFLQIPSCILVAHDFGGIIALEWMKTFQPTILHLVVINSWAEDLSKDKAYKQMKRLLHLPFMRWLYLHTSFSPQFLLPKSFADFGPFKKFHQQYLLPFKSKRDRMGLWKFAESLRDRSHYFGTFAEALQCYKTLSLTTIWGMKDPFVKPERRIAWHQIFTLKEDILLSNIGHFPQEEAVDCNWINIFKKL